MEGKDYVVTFGAGQFGSTMADTYIQFRNATERQVRQWMHKHFAGKWSGTYGGLDGKSYLTQHKPMRLAEVTFDEPGDGEFDIDRYTTRTKEVAERLNMIERIAKEADPRD